jgi:hypothetical protein
MKRVTLSRASRALLLASLLLVGAIALPATASATTVDECQAQLTQLRADTVAAQSSFTNAKDFNGAIGKLDAAALKLSEGKNADAVLKLQDFQTLLNALATAPKPKLDPATAQALIPEAQGVIDCINQIGTA